MYPRFLPTIAVVVALAVFAVLVGQAIAAEPTVMVAQDPTLGSILVDSKGMTLYLFTKDTPNQSNCAGNCLANWPPLTVAEGVEPTAAEGLAGQLGVFVHPDGARQVTYNGTPLYYWIKDTKPGDTTGQGVGGVWFIVPPAAEPTVKLGQDPTLGSFLTDAKGMTLYLFTKDTADTSNCSGKCLVNWPALTVAEGITPTAGVGITGTLATIVRADDATHQVTYDGMPLYYWIKDTKPGDTTGQGVGDVWFVVPPVAPAK